MEAISATGRPVIVPLDVPKPPNVGTPEAALGVPLRELMHWDLAPENPARLVEAGVPIALTTDGLKSPKEFLAAVRKAVERGLDADAALRALTIEPAASRRETVPSPGTSSIVESRSSPSSALRKSSVRQKTFPMLARQT